MFLATGGDSLYARDAHVVVTLHPVEACLKFARMSPDIDELFLVRRGGNVTLMDATHNS